MRKKNNDKLFEIINDFKKIMTEKPPLPQMLEEIRMMRFKVHPLHGDIASLILNNGKLIEIFWTLGKIDDLLQNKYKKLSTTNKRLFTQALNEIFFQLEEQLKTVNFKDDVSFNSPLLELEVYKEHQKKLN